MTSTKEIPGISSVGGLGPTKPAGARPATGELELANGLTLRSAMAKVDKVEVIPWRLRPCLEQDGSLLSLFAVLPA